LERSFFRKKFFVMGIDFVDGLRDFLSAGAEWASFDITLEPCPDGMGGDFTVNCFRFAKVLKANPMDLAERAGEYLRGRSEIESVDVVKAFVNIVLSPEALHGMAVARSEELPGEGAVPAEERKRILVEYSAPNTNKPQHLGHVRNNTLGMSLVSLLRKAGHDVVAVNLVNDRGIHICKSMVAYRRFGNGATPESAGKKGDHFVGDFYVEFEKEFQRQLAELKTSKPELEGKSSDELFLETDIGREAQETLREWEAGDEKVRGLWKTMNSWVLAGFEETYRRMGVEFDKTYYESGTYSLGRDIILDGMEKGIFNRRADGAVVIDLGKKLGEKVVLRSDGTSVYITQDIGTTLKKRDEFAPDSQVWVVGDEQKRHFEVLFAILARLGVVEAENFRHLAYGMVNLPSGKMKSREGTVVDADDLFDEMAGLARSATLERHSENVPDDVEERSETIGMGALKFMLLKFNPKTTIMFNPEESVKFEGDTGPYVQYACARINSILRKVGVSTDEPVSADIDWSLLSSSYERRISVLALQYPAVLRKAASAMDCSGIVTYLLDLSKAFNRFYRECPVLAADNESLKLARLELCRRVRGVLADGLDVLTIGVPEAM